MAIVQYWDHFFPTKLSRQTQYAGLNLGMKPEEVMYIKGYPPVVISDEAARSIASTAYRRRSAFPTSA